MSLWGTLVAAAALGCRDIQDAVAIFNVWPDEFGDFQPGRRFETGLAAFFFDLL